MSSPGTMDDPRVTFMGATSASRSSVAVMATALPTLIMLVTGAKGVGSTMLTVVAFGGSVATAALVRRDGVVPRNVWPVIVLFAVVAVARMPLLSNDLWSYAFYGRISAFYGGDPYRIVPRSHPRDFVYPLVHWRNTASVYGPLFNIYSAVVARVAGRSLLWLRLGFQLMAAGSVVGSLWLLARRGRAATMVLVALQPFVWIAVVNGGHNDAIVAFLLLLAVIIFERRLIGRAAVIVAVAAMVKLSAVLVVVPLVVFLVARRRWRDAAITATVPSLVLISGELVYPGSLTNASQATDHKISMASVWGPVPSLIGVNPVAVTMVAGLAILGLVLMISWRRRNDATVGLAAGSSLAMFGIAGSYTLSWYSIWGLPILALSGDLVATGLVAARGSLMMAAYQLRGSSIEDLASRVVLAGTVPIILLVLFVTHVAHRPGWATVLSNEVLPRAHRRMTGVEPADSYDFPHDSSPPDASRHSDDAEQGPRGHALLLDHQDHGDDRRRDGGGHSR
jgi:hypothetical protein